MSKKSLTDDDVYLRAIRHCHEQLDKTLNHDPRDPHVTGLVRILEGAIKSTNARIDLFKADAGRANQAAFNSFLFALLLHTSFNNPKVAESILEIAKSHLHATEPDNETAVLKLNEIGALMRKAIP